MRIVSRIVQLSNVFAIEQPVGRLLESFTKFGKVHIDTVPRVSRRLARAKRLQRKGFACLSGGRQAFALGFVRNIPSFGEHPEQQ